jgi:hypothetical protein
VATPDRAKLVHAPYRPPRLRKDDRAFCLLRDCLVVITGWTGARISWPRCRALDGPGGRSGILLDEELARAVRCESAAAICHWWGVSEGVVWRWRKVLGVTRTNNEGSQRLIHTAAEAGDAVLRGKELSDAECDARSRRAIELNLKRFRRPGYHGPRWSPEQLRQLGTAPDAVVAAQIGRTAEAVRAMRDRLGIPNPAARPGAYGSPRWSADEDDLVYRLSPAEAARRTGRTLGAVYSRRSLLGLGAGRGEGRIRLLRRARP